MKKIALILFIALAGLSACKKSSKKSSAPPILSEADLLDRTVWHNILLRHEYRDANNNRLLKTNDSSAIRYKFAAGQVQVTDLNNNVTAGTYALSTANGTDMLAITLNGHTDNYKIVTLNENYLYLTEDISNATYTEGGVQKVAASDHITFNLKCACE